MRLWICTPVIQLLFHRYANPSFALHLIAGHEMHKSDWTYICVLF